MEGKVIKLVRHRGFGFINAEDFDEDIFFHHSGLENTYFEDLSVGDVLKFELNQTDKGPEATGIQKVSTGETETPEKSIENHLGW